MAYFGQRDLTQRTRRDVALTTCPMNRGIDAGTKFNPKVAIYTISPAFQFKEHLYISVIPDIALYPLGVRLNELLAHLPGLLDSRAFKESVMPLGSSRKFLLEVEVIEKIRFSNVVPSVTPSSVSNR